MFYFDPIFEATIVAVAEPGVPNRERVILRPTQEVNLGQFGLTVAIRSAENPNLILPINDNFFWFPSIIVTTPCWLFVYTGKGTYEETTLIGTSETAHVFHWGRTVTVFNNFELVPVLFRQSGILIGPNPDRPALPKLPPLPPTHETSSLAGLPPRKTFSWPTQPLA